MKCPNCNETLVMTDRSGVEIDYCPNCRGVWLDRGELDKIIERSSNTGDNYQTGRDSRQSQNYSGSQHNYSGDQQYGSRRKKKDSFLGDLFDF